MDKIRDDGKEQGMRCKFTFSSFFFFLETIRQFPSLINPK